MAIEKVLVVDDEESIRWVLSKALTKKGIKADLTANGREALMMARRNRYQLAIVDIKMPEMNGLELLTTLQNEQPELLVVIMTAQSSMKNTVEAMKRGAYDYLSKPFDLEALDAILLKADKASAFATEVDQLKEELRDHYQTERTIIGNNAKMQELYKMLGKVAPSDETVLIIGESGTGKELFARAIHYNSNRVGKPFLAINCAAIPRDLLEAELFGFEKGAFTGATERKIGKFEQADGGTLFLDEIGDMPLELQAKLLRVLQEKEITRTGGSATLKINTRIIAATNQNLKEQVEAKEFREDLYYRLNVVPLSLPPLRERRDDIPLLVEFFLQKCREEMKSGVQGCTDEAIKLLSNYHWPGNARELENSIRRASLLSKDMVLTPVDFPDLISGQGHSAGNGESSLEDLVAGKLESALAPTQVEELNDLYDMVMEQVERPLIEIVLKKTRGNQVKTAEVLGINRNTLRKKINHLKIDVKRWAAS